VLVHAELALVGVSIVFVALSCVLATWTIKNARRANRNLELSRRILEGMITHAEHNDPH
jgi:energy-converting hydrogenase Eha subunit E